MHKKIARASRAPLPSSIIHIGPPPCRIPGSATANYIRCATRIPNIEKKINPARSQSPPVPLAPHKVSYGRENILLWQEYDCDGTYIVIVGRGVMVYFDSRNTMYIVIVGTGVMVYFDSRSTMYCDSREGCEGRDYIVIGRVGVMVSLPPYSLPTIATST